MAKKLSPEQYSWLHGRKKAGNFTKPAYLADHFEITHKHLDGHQPDVFTAQGVAMLITMLKSETAVQGPDGFQVRSKRTVANG